MPQPLLTLLGFVAATLTTAAFVPQMVRVWRLRSANDISGAMYTIFIIGLLLWIIYGVYISAWPIVIANSLTAGQSAAILWMKRRFVQTGSSDAPSVASKPASIA